MSKILYKCFRGAVLGLMLLLAGAANLVCVSYDTDNDEDTPPITVEMNLVTPRKNTHLPNKNVQAETIRQKDLQAASPTLVAALSIRSLPILNTSLLQQDLPLRR
jgi:hypothetical protein